MYENSQLNPSSINKMIIQHKKKSVHLINIVIDNYYSSNHSSVSYPKFLHQDLATKCSKFKEFKGQRINLLSTYYK